MRGGSSATEVPSLTKTSRQRLKRMSVGDFSPAGSDPSTFSPRAHDPRLKMPQTMVDKGEAHGGDGARQSPELLDELNECFSDAHAEAVRVRRLRLRRAVPVRSCRALCGLTDEVRDLIHDGEHPVARKHGFLTGFMAQAKGMFEGDAAGSHVRLFGVHGTQRRARLVACRFCRLALTFVCFTSKHTRRPELLSRS